jgi:hypothetical protein
VEARARTVALGADQILACKRDLDGERLWLRILEAIETLQATERPEGTVVQ